MATVAARRAPLLPVVLALSLTALTLRDVGTWSILVPLLGAIGVVGAQTVPARTSDRIQWIAVTVAGAAACLVVRLALPGIRTHATVLAIVASVVAGVTEEVIFRRGVYGALERGGPAVAIVVSALAFGLVHAPMYGWTVVPVDVAAGLVFGWQRWCTGGWTSPAVTHATANVLGGI